MRRRALRLVVLLLAALTLLGSLDTAIGQLPGEYCTLELRCRGFCPGEWFWVSEQYWYWRCCRVYPDGGEDCNYRWDRRRQCCT